MSQFLEALENSAAAAALKTSFVVYPLVNALHIAAIGMLVTSVLVMHARAAGLMGALDPLAMQRTFRFVALWAFAVAALSGLALFAVNAGDYAANPAFRIKVLLLALAGLNFAAWLVFAKWRKAGAIASALLWPAILVAGRFIGFV